jgi:uncharacterized membrane protein YkvA (DUF1232 family)
VFPVLAETIGRRGSRESGDADAGLGMEWAGRISGRRMVVRDVSGSWWVDALLGVLAGLAGAWIALIAALVIVRPRGGLLGEAVRVLPDALRLVRRLAGDRELPRGVRVRLALLLAYLAFPVDLVPDFIPVLGYADDAIVVAVVLRSVVRRAGLAAVRRHWPGSDDGFAALCRLTGLTEG